MADIFDAIANGNKDKVKKIIQGNEKILLTCWNGLTPIQYAAKEWQWSIVETIAQYCSDDNGHYRFGAALQYTVYRGKYDLSELLLKEGATTAWHWTSNPKNYPLHDAVNNKDVALVKLLLSYDNGRSVNKKNLDDFTPFELACEKGLWQIAEAFVACEELSILDDDANRKILAEAFNAGQDKVVDFLLSRGVAMTIAHPLHQAVKKNYSEMIIPLLKHNFQQLDRLDRQTAFELALELDHARCVRAFLVYNLNRQQDNDENDTLHMYVFAMVNQYHLEKYIFYAIESNRPDIVASLVQQEVNPFCKNRNGKTACDYARELKHYQCLVALSKIPLTKVDYARPDGEVLHDLLTANKISGELIPEFIEYLQTIDREMLEIAQTNVKNNTTTQRIILSLINNSDYFVSDKDIAEIQKESLPAGNYIQDYLAHRSEVSDFARRIAYDYLIQKRKEMQDYQGKWLIKNWQGKFVMGTPGHVEQIENLLTRLNDHSTSRQILEILAGVITTVAHARAVSPGKRENRDINTTVFYENTWSEIQKLPFTPPSYQQALEQTRNYFHNSIHYTLTKLSTPPPSAPALATIDLHQLTYETAISSVTTHLQPVYETSLRSRQQNRNDMLADAEFNIQMNNLPKPQKGFNGPRLFDQSSSRVPIAEEKHYVHAK